MILPPNIERDLQAVELELSSRGGQQAGPPRLRGLRASIELALLHCAGCDHVLRCRYCEAPLCADGEGGWTCPRRAEPNHA